MNIQYHFSLMNTPQALTLEQLIGKDTRIDHEERAEASSRCRTSWSVHAFALVSAVKPRLCSHFTLLLLTLLALLSHSHLRHEGV